MRAVVQRVSRARVAVGGQTAGAIGRGLLVYVSVAKADGQHDVEYLADKVANLRVFEDEAGRMNLAAGQVGAEILVVSNFTLHGDCRKGRRPSFNAAGAYKARELYEETVAAIEGFGFEVQTGVFGEHMEVESVNDGPVNLLLDSERVV